MTTTVEPAPVERAGSGAAVARMQAIVAELASTGYQGRRVGTDGGRSAATWLAGYLARIGATVTLDEFTVAGVVREVYATPVLRMNDGPDLVFRRDFCEHLASADAPTVRSGRIAPIDDPALAGAWALDTGFSADRVARAADAGAIGVLVPRGVDDAGWMPKMIAGPAPVAVPVLAVRNEVHRQMSGTAVGSVPVRTTDVVGANVYGVLHPERADGMSVLLTAHYDGVGDDPGGTRFPAAADNASGVAVVIEAAQQLSGLLPPHVGLSVALLDAEEAGAHGSAYHAPQVKPGTFVINVDGAAALHQAAAVEAGGPAEILLAALDQAGRQTGVPLRAAAMPSDNRRYAAAGLAAVGIGMGLPGYQTPAETPDRVDPATLHAAAQLVISAVRHLVEFYR